MSKVNISYTNRNIEVARQEGMRQIPLITQGKWTDLNPTDPGIVLLDYAHALTDMIQFYQDHQALEAYMSSANERKNILTLAKQYSYKAKSATGAECTVVVSLERAIDNNIIIPKGTKFRSKADATPLKFLSVDEVILYAGQTEVSVPVTEGELRTLKFNGKPKAVQILDLGRDLNQLIDLPNELIDSKSIVIYDDTQELWSEIDFIFYAEGDEKKYELNLQADNHIQIKLGDGIRGKLLGTDDTITVQYIVTNGDKGNVGIGKIDSIEDQLRSSNGSVVTVKVTNPEPATGGKNPQTDEEIKQQAPAVLKTMWRAVMPEDFETLAKEVNGVIDAKALDIRSAPDLCLHHEVKLVIIPSGGGAPGQTLKQEVFDYLYPRTIPPTVLQIIEPVYKDIDFHIVVASDERFMDEEIEYNINRVLQSYFESIVTKFGEILRYNSLLVLLSTVNGVRHIESLTPGKDITLSRLELPRLGSVTVEVKKGV